MIVRSQCLSDVSNTDSGHERWSDILLINGFHKLSDDEWNTLYSLDFFLSSHKFALETPRSPPWSVESLLQNFLAPTFVHLLCIPPEA